MSALIEQLNAIKSSLSTYIEGLDRYSKTQFEFKVNEETWSLAEMYEHLSLSSRKFFLANAKRCFEQRNGQLGGEKTENGMKLMAAGSFPNVKIKLPSGIPSPIPGDKTIGIFITEFVEIANSAEDMLNALEHDAGEYKMLHPIFGFLNAKEWYQNLEMHLRHHLRQKTELEELAQNAS